MTSPPPHPSWWERLVAPILLAAAWAPWLPGCLVNTDLYEERRAELVDDDGDGVSDAQGDCDDANPRVLPGAPEPCNGFDDNCDGQVDEPAAGNDLHWAADADGDGYASDSATSFAACVSPGAGWVSAAGDCDDADAGVWPGAPEACDGTDNDCDGAADEEPTVAPPTWYPDEDEDGHGEAGGGVSQCLAPEGSGWARSATDCDDTDAAIHPDAPERCNGADDDCDGTADEAPVAEGGGWYPDADGDGYGDDAAAACTAAEGFVDVGGDCDDADGAVHPGATEVCNDGADNDCDGTPGGCEWDSAIDMTSELRISAANNNQGLSFSGATGDLDGDGRVELAIGANGLYSTDLAANLGGVRVFETPITTDVDEEAADWTFWGEHDYSGAGSSVVVQDVDGDGYDDLHVGSHNTIDGEQYAGTVYTLFGPLGSGGALEERADWKLVGTSSQEFVGVRSYAFGDLDGDGLPDFGTGYEYRDYNGVDRSGAVYVFTSVSSGTEAAADAATALVYGSDDGDEIGYDATGLDLDGDGYNDLVVGAQGYDEGSTDGAALVFMGPVAGSIAGDDADVRFTAEGATNYAGQAVDPLGDVNGDGLDDLLVGAPQAGEGSAYVLWGDATITTRGLGDADVTFRADRMDKHLGRWVEGLGDLDGDGWPDLFLSEEDVADGDVWAYVFFGPFETTATYRSGDADVTLTGDTTDRVYETAFTPGDATGDGVSDLVVGSYQHGVEWWDGVVYVVPGVGY